jgi:hypothetical protein
MRCERAQELFSEYYEGSIQTALSVPLEGHLQACSACREEFDGLKHVWPILDTAPVVEPPAGFRAAVWQRIDAEEARRATERWPLFRFDWRALFPRPALGWAAAAAAVIVLSGVVVPGVYTPARLFFPWSAFSSQPARSANVTVGEPRVFDEPAGQILKVHVQNPGPSPVRVDVRVDSGAVDRNHSSFIAPAGANGWFAVGTVRAGDNAPVRVSTSWQPAF